MGRACPKDIFYTSFHLQFGCEVISHLYMSIWPGRFDLHAHIPTNLKQVRFKLLNIDYAVWSCPNWSEKKFIPCLVLSCLVLSCLDAGLHSTGSQMKMVWCVHELNMQNRVYSRTWTCLWHFCCRLLTFFEIVFSYSLITNLDPWVDIHNQYQIAHKIK